MAVGRWKPGQREVPAGVHRLSELLPPLCHEVVAELEEALVEPRGVAGLLAAVRYDFQYLGCSELRILGHAYGVELYEFRHLLGDFSVFH